MLQRVSSGTPFPLPHSASSGIAFSDQLHILRWKSKSWPRSVRSSQFHENTQISWENNSTVVQSDSFLQITASDYASFQQTDEFPNRRPWHLWKLILSRLGATSTPSFFLKTKGFVRDSRSWPPAAAAAADLNTLGTRVNTTPLVKVAGLLELERWLRTLPALAEDQDGFLASTWQLTIISNCISRGSDILFWPVQSL